MVPPAPGAAAAGEGLPGRWMMRTLDAGGRRGGAQQRRRRCSCLRRPATARAAPSCRRTPNASIYCFIHRRHQHQHQHQLDEVAIESIALTRYHDGACMLGATDCPVCLGEFRDGELLRLLPKCGRAFYVPCIDAWLRAVGRGGRRRRAGRQPAAARSNRKSDGDDGIRDGVAWF
uniref:RING-type E3 ubiquitin transferase n=1 Tax=Oryza meridionalis TaxID=40149 RepID=A0A0E0DEQ3_9ORYZ